MIRKTLVSFFRSKQDWSIWRTTFSPSDLGKGLLGSCSLGYDTEQSCWNKSEFKLKSVSLHFLCFLRWWITSTSTQSLKTVLKNDTDFPPLLPLLKNDQDSGSKLFSCSPATSLLHSHLPGIALHQHTPRSSYWSPL